MTGAASPVARAYALMQQGRAGEALAIAAARAALPQANAVDHTLHAEVLTALNRLDEALAAYRKAVAVAPRAGAAEHNLARLQQRLGLFAEAEMSLRRAFAKKWDAAESWGLLGHVLQAQERHDEAEQAYRAALARNPGLADIQLYLSQLIWMRTGDIAKATAELRAALEMNPDPMLAVQLATALRYGGRPGEGLAMLRGQIARTPAPDAALELAAGVTALELGDAQAAQAHARRALAAAPDDPAALTALFDAMLAQGEAAAALPLMEKLHARFPHEQNVIARLATASRLLGLPGYPALYDYDAMVWQEVIAAPAGWPDLPAFLAALAAALDRRHTMQTHPFSQSLRHGSQTFNDLAASSEPVLRAFWTAVEDPVRRFRARLGCGADPLRQRNGGGHRVHGAWSVRLKSGGHHVNHTHQDGWLSCAFYVRVPPAAQGTDHQGWLKLGEPGIATVPRLTAERFVQPRPGMLVIFPSYMWHGTVAFSDTADRLSLAFDLVPG